MLDIFRVALCGLLCWVCTFAFAKQADARRWVTIQSNASYKQTKEYKLLVRYLRYRGFHLATSHTTRKKAYCLVRPTKDQLCIHYKHTSQSFYSLQRLHSPTARARTIMLYFNIFLQHIQETRGEPAPKETQTSRCGCQEHHPPKRTHKRTPKKRRRTALGTVRKNIRTTPPRPTPRPVTKPKQVLRPAPPKHTTPRPQPVPRIRPKPQPTPRPIDKRPPPRKNEPIDELPGFGSAPKPTNKTTPSSQWTPWFGVSLGLGLRFNPPTKALPGSNTSILFGIGPLFLQGGLATHAFFLRNHRPIFLARPTLLLGWELPVQPKWMGRPLTFSILLGATSEFFIREPGTVDQEYITQMEWGMLGSARIAWEWNKGWNLFLRASFIAYPHAFAPSANQQKLSPDGWLQVSAHVGLLYRFSFFEKK